MTGIVSIANLDEELGVSRALRDMLNAPDLDGTERPGIARVLQRLDRRVLEAAVMLLVAMLRSKELEPQATSWSSAGSGAGTPLSLPELTARARAAYQRIQRMQPEIPRTISIKEIELDPTRRVVLKGDATIHLTPKEFDLLEYLMVRAGVPVRHAELLQKIWGPQYAQEVEYLRTYIYRLRKKLEDNPTVPQYLLPEPYFGYRFVQSTAV